MREENPYASPTSIENPAEVATPRPRAFWLELRDWAIVIAANLPVPMLFGLSLVDGPAFGGVITAHGLMIAAGVGLQFLPAWWVESMTAGLLSVAATQIVPVVQMIAGAIAISLTKRLGVTGVGLDPPTDMGPAVHGYFGGLVAALINWSLLIAVAMAVGLFLRSVLPAERWKTHPRPQNYGTTRQV